MLLIYSMTYELVRKTDTRIHLIVRGDAVRDRAGAPVTGRLAPRQPVHKLVADPSFCDRNFFSLSYYAYSPVPGVGVGRRGMSEIRRGVRAAGGMDRDDD